GGWRMAGERGWVTGYSFFPSKNLGAWGDGGMMVTSDDALAERLRKLRLHGGAKQYHHDEVGTNSRLDSLQAAVLLAKLPHLASWSSRRRDHAAYYDKGLSDVPGVRVPAVDPANEHIYHQYTVRVERRDELQAHLKAKGIGSAVYYPVPLHLQNCFAHLGYQPGRLPQAERACREVLSLPVFPELTRQQLDYVIETIRGFYRGPGSSSALSGPARGGGTTCARRRASPTANSPRCATRTPSGESSCVANIRACTSPPMPPT